MEAIISSYYLSLMTLIWLMIEIFVACCHQQIIACCERTEQESQFQKIEEQEIIPQYHNYDQNIQVNF